MYCPHCGFPLKAGAQYCESCGQQIAPPQERSKSSAISDDSAQPAPATIQKKPMPIWFKILIAISAIALIAVTIGILFTESLVEVVDDQLSALKNNDLDKAYYDYTSLEFQRATSFEEFKKIVEANPIFTENQSAYFSERSIKNQTEIQNRIATLKGTLTSSQNQKVPIEYRLIKEKDDWKILNIRLLSPTEEEKAEYEKLRKEIISVIQLQLTDLQKNKIGTAYENYVSPEFKKATNLDSFKQFLNNFPLIADHQTASYELVAIDDKMAKANASLQDQTENILVEYIMIKQENGWKVWSIRVLRDLKELLTPPGNPD